MSKKTEREDQVNWTESVDWYERTHKHWRSWGSWFSWGSPIGLGLFLLAVAGAVWIFSKI